MTFSHRRRLISMRGTRSPQDDTQWLRHWLGTILIVLVMASTCVAKDEVYESGKLIEIKALKMDLMGYPITTAYSFSVLASDLLYIGTCQAREFKAADWIVNDPVIFRAHKNELFLKQSHQKKVFRLGLAGVARIPVPPKNPDSATK